MPSVIIVRLLAYNIMMKKKNAHIISLIKAGREDGFRAAVDLFGQRMYAFLLDITGSPEDAEELVNDAFINAFRNIDKYEAGKASFSTWLFRIAYNLAISHLRKHRILTIGIETIKEVAVPGNAIINEGTDDRLDTLSDAIAHLNPEERSIIHQYYYEQATIEDISFVIGQSASNTAVRLHRIRQKLKKIIESNYHHDR